jgi:hypothetical protein
MEVAAPKLQLAEAKRLMNDEKQRAGKTVINISRLSGHLFYVVASLCGTKVQLLPWAPLSLQIWPLKHSFIVVATPKAVVVVPRVGVDIGVHTES